MDLDACMLHVFEHASCPDAIRAMYRHSFMFSSHRSFTIRRFRGTIARAIKGKRAAHSWFGGAACQSERARELASEREGDAAHSWFRGPLVELLARQSERGSQQAREGGTAKRREKTEEQCIRGLVELLARQSERGR